MNVYEEIEKSYLNTNAITRTENFLRRIYAIIAIISIITALFLSSLSFNIKYLLIIFTALLITIISCIVFILYNYKNKKINFKATSYKDEINALVKVLKKNHVKTQTEIDFIRSYYLKSKPISIKNNTFIEFISLTLSISAFLFASYIPEKNIFYSLPLMLVLGICFSIIVHCFNFLINLYNIRDDKFYSEIEQRLTYIYLNFDEYFTSPKKNFNSLIKQAFKHKNKN